MRNVGKRIFAFILSIMMVMIVPVNIQAFDTSDWQLYNSTAVEITYAGQIVDSITFNGHIVNAVYRPNDGTLGTDTTYSCAAFVKKFYSEVYGISVYNLSSTSSIPLIMSGSGEFTKTSNPKVGDIVRDNQSTHWAIVKSISGNEITVIQQNAWWAGKAWVGAHTSSSDSRYSYFTYSGNGNSGSDIPSTRPIYLDSTKFSNVNSGDITDTSARIYTDISKETYDELGFYFGTSNDFYSMTKVCETTVTDTYYGNSYKLGVWYDDVNGYKWWQPLTPGQTYYYAFYVVQGNATYVSSIQSFTTNGGDTVSPIISDVKVVKDSSGYTVTCNVTDNVGVTKVEFPTWTSYNDQDDLPSVWPQGTKSGNTYTYRVWDCEHNLERGNYNTHIYAFDAAGNRSCYEINGVNVQNTYQSVAQGIYKNSKYLVYDDLLSWSSAKTKCEQLGGHLAVITSQGEQDIIAPLISGREVYRGGYYLGGTLSNKQLSWITDETVSYSNWCEGQPDNAQGKEPVLEMLTSSKSWNDAGDSGFAVGFICEIEFPIYFDKSIITLGKGEYTNLKLTNEESELSVDDLLWTSSNTSVATVSAGKITAVNPGTATIKAMYGTKSATCTVTVKAPLKGISLNKTSATLNEGSTSTLTVSYNPSNTTDSKTVTWTSSNTSVATVNSNGVVTAVKAGTATITAKVGSYTATCNITVKAPLKGISLDKTSATLDEGATSTLTVSYNPSNTTDSKTVTWTSSNTSVATVNSNGVVTAVKAGTATITAKVGSYTSTCNVTVKATQQNSGTSNQDNSSNQGSTSDQGNTSTPETPTITNDMGWNELYGKAYWYESGVRQGTYDDPKGVIGDGTVRGREIYDPVSDGWYWLDSCYDGAKARSKEVWMPYIYQNEKDWQYDEIEANAANSGSMSNQVIDTIQKELGKWVRYDANGKMIKGWYTVEGDDAAIYPSQKGNTYYYDPMTGLMAKGYVTIDGKTYHFDEITGALIKGNNTSGESQNQEGVAKPAKISIMCDGTVIPEWDDAQAFYDQLSAATGIQLEWIRPNHSGYANEVNNIFTTGTNLPDVVLLSYDAYDTYASLGYLWDMTDAWNNSEVKKSGRLTPNAVEYFESNKVEGKDGQKHLYGFTPSQGNGCITYIKQSWLDAAGISTLPTTFAEYHDMLVKMKEATGKAPVTSAGVFCAAAPYINYLPEFYQDAYPEFYEKNGVWVDGFSEDAMKAALQRLADAYKEGLIDSDTFTITTSEARTKYEADGFGVFTYWAGTWRGNLITNIKKANKYPAASTETLAVLEPIAEVGAYLNRYAPLWCITTSCENPEGVFEYFLQKMLDGRECQMLWEYGAEGTHYTYDGTTFTQLNRNSTGKPGTKNHFDGMLKLGEYASDYNNGVDVGLASAKPESIEAMEIFNRTSKQSPAIRKTEEFTDYSAKIWAARKQLTESVTKGEMTVDDAMNQYNTLVGSEVQKVLESLNR